MLITVFTRARHRSLCWARRIQCRLQIIILATPGLQYWRMHLNQVTEGRTYKDGYWGFGTRTHFLTNPRLRCTLGLHTGRLQIPTAHYNHHNRMGTTRCLRPLKYWDNGSNTGRGIPWDGMGRRPTSIITVCLNKVVEHLHSWDTRSESRKITQAGEFWITGLLQFTDCSSLSDQKS
jgi:hypothetical protein